MSKSLRALMLRKKLTELQGEKKNLEERAAKLATREAEAENAIEEINEDSTQEEKDAVSEEVEAIEAEKEALAKEEEDLAKKIANTEKEIAENEKSEPAPAPEEDEQKEEERKKEKPAMNREKFFGFDAQERAAFFGDDAVKGFLKDVRTRIREKRDFTNIGLTIPQNFLPLIKQVAEQNSKLSSLVRHISLQGTARQVIMGDIPEAVWTEACATLNELTLGFNEVEVEGYKVGGFFEICNATLEDNDVNLASELVNALGRAIGKALDKAIVYGTGIKMPLGIVTRLAQTTQPADYLKTARPWKNLSTSNVLTVTGTGKKLFQEIVKLRGVIKNKYSAEGLVWIMNSTTHTQLLAESMDALTAPAIIAGMNDTMPIIGGKIVELDEVMADGDIVFGYMSNYLLVQRAGMEIRNSEHYHFVQDRTVVKGTARYDGLPVIAEAFAIVNIKNVAPTTTATFVPDKANTPTDTGE